MKSVIVIAFTVENYWDKATQDNNLWNQFEQKLQQTLEKELDVKNVSVLAVSPEDLGVKFQLEVLSNTDVTQTEDTQPEDTDFFTKIKNKVKFKNE